MIITIQYCACVITWKLYVLFTKLTPDDHSVTWAEGLGGILDQETYGSSLPVTLEEPSVDWKVYKNTKCCCNLLYARPCSNMI